MKGANIFITKVITHGIRLAGIILAVNEGLFQDPPRDATVFALAAFMMAGATGFENAIDKFIGAGDKK